MRVPRNLHDICIWTRYHHYRIMELLLKNNSILMATHENDPAEYSLVRLFTTAIQFLSVVVALTIVPALHLPHLLLVLLAGFLLSSTLTNLYIPSPKSRRFLRHQLILQRLRRAKEHGVFLTVQRMICAGKTSFQIAHIGQDCVQELLFRFRLSSVKVGQPLHCSRLFYSLPQLLNRLQWPQQPS